MFGLVSDTIAPWDLPREAANSDARFKIYAAIRGRKADWTAGLSTRTANALRAHGLRSREAVEALSESALQRIPNFGRISLQDLRRWLRNAPKDGSQSPRGTD